MCFGHVHFYLLFVPLFLLTPFFFMRSPYSSFMFSLFVTHWAFWGLFTGEGRVCLLGHVSVTNDYTIKESISLPPPPPHQSLSAQGVMGPHEPLLLPCQASDRTNLVDILGKQIAAAVSSRVSRHIKTKSQHSIPLMMAPAPSSPILCPCIRSASSSILLLSSGVGNVGSYPFWCVGSCFSGPAWNEQLWRMGSSACYRKMESHCDITLWDVQEKNIF